MSRNDLRYELKLASEVHLYEEVRALLRLHSVGLSPIHHPRKVQSLYFDSSTDEALGDNLAGISHREKIRFRWYGVGTVGVRGRLEKKVRENMQGWKELGEVDGIFNIEGARREELKAEIAAATSPEWRELLSRDLEIVQWISYEREYLATSDGRVRVTLDRDLKTWDQRFSSRLSRRWRTPTPDLMILECKVAPEDLHRAEGLLESLPVSVDKCSKFVIASSPGDAPLRSMRTI